MIEKNGWDELSPRGGEPQARALGVSLGDAGKGSQGASQRTGAGPTRKAPGRVPEPGRLVGILRLMRAFLAGFDPIRAWRERSFGAVRPYDLQAAGPVARNQRISPLRKHLVILMGRIAGLSGGRAGWLLSLRNESIHPASWCPAPRRSPRNFADEARRGPRTRSHQRVRTDGEAASGCTEVDCLGRRRTLCTFPRVHATRRSVFDSRSVLEEASAR